ncbi:ras-related protein RABE1e-like [Stylophora pistillata]|uniref:Ras-related protein Rab-9A n=1 Tax=Stylophora pistillata TaxID=50429 RepID=A0A2B4RZF2_STYPI|nr:ras-related protein RABE1e-like [Stylophora pistillata]PFX23834.1 Ras-related protein Rab-9A [Stylophora pistillata]
MNNEENIPLYKIVLAGDLGVGKTSIFRRYDVNKFSEYRESTFGLDKLNKDIEVDGKRLKINVWDTAGMERTRSLTSNYYHNSQAVILVYAIDDMYSLTMLRNWIIDINKDAGEALKFLVGNKIDLTEEGTQVDKQLADQFCNNNGITKLYEVSAKTGKGVREMFDDIAKLLLANKESTKRDEKSFILIKGEANKEVKKESGCSC